MKDERFAEKLTPYLEKLARESPAIKAMYYTNLEYENLPADRSRDLLNEKISTPLKGLVQKYEGRILFLLSYTCAANCRYCERQDRVGVGLDKEGRLTKEMIDNSIKYIKEEKNIYEVIFSGGDPLSNPIGLLYATEKLSKLDQIKVLRIHTRLLLQAPNKIKMALFEKLIKLQPIFYLSIHIDHPDELTQEVRDLLVRLRKMGYILISQSVFLKGVNDSVEILEKMFLELFFLGVRPYYIYHCLEIPTTKHFVMDIEKEIEIMTRLREKTSGLAYPQHVIDLPHTTGKIIFPSNHWDFDKSITKDFLGKNVKL